MTADRRISPERVRCLILDFAERLDSALDATDGHIFERIVLMQTRDSLRRYGGLWDTPRCRKVIERLPDALEAAAGPEGFPDDLMNPIRVTCERAGRSLRKV